MLTSHLVRAKVRGQYMKLSYIKETDSSLLGVASTLINIYNYHQNKTKGELQNCFDDSFGQSSNNLITKGLFKLLEDRCQFEFYGKENPVELRQKLFVLASQKHQEGCFVRSEVIDEVVTSTNLPNENIRQLLFSDLKDNHVMVDFSDISSHNLLKRYNTALAQAILLKASKLEITIKDKERLRYRQLFRAIKFRQLLYAISGSAKNGFKIVLDGPINIFRSSQKYGLQMALFFPALLLCDRWQLRAEVEWKKQTKIFRVDHKQNLHSHYPDTGMYFPEEMKVFVKRFSALASDWNISSHPDFLEMDSQQICIPDYVFTHKQKDISVYLEIFGFWRKSALEKRLQTNMHGKNIILAVSEKLNVSEKAALHMHESIYYYKSVLIPRAVLKMLNTLYLKEQT
ncbi:DUF790 family protein [Candidatus Uabimicrobium sp. HlEnr_7]|uniref:DUF790 family protein n=1 Tax=Candidatus Uabimicrobium helgolandensis TaxID=3095367 RepID=UPI003557E100